MSAPINIPKPKPQFFGEQFNFNGISRANCPGSPHPKKGITGFEPENMEHARKQKIHDFNDKIKSRVETINQLLFLGKIEKKIKNISTFIDNNYQDFDIDERDILKNQFSESQF